MKILKRLEIVKKILDYHLEPTLTHEFSEDQLDEILSRSDEIDFSRFNQKCYLLKYYFENKEQRELIDSMDKESENLLNIYLGEFDTDSNCIQYIMEHHEQLSKFRMKDRAIVINTLLKNNDITLDKLFETYMEFRGDYGFQIQMLLNNLWICEVEHIEQVECIKDLVEVPDNLIELYKKYGYYQNAVSISDTLIDYINSLDKTEKQKFPIDEELIDFIIEMKSSDKLISFFNSEITECSEKSFISNIHSEQMGNIYEASKTRQQDLILWCVLHDKKHFLQCIEKEGVEMIPKWLLKVKIQDYDFDLDTIENFSEFQIRKVYDLQKGIYYNLDILRYLECNPNAIDLYNELYDLYDVDTLNLVEQFEGYFHELDVSSVKQYLEQYTLNELKKIYTDDMSILVHVLSYQFNWRKELLKYAEVIRRFSMKHPIVNSAVSIFYRVFQCNKGEMWNAPSDEFFTKNYTKILELLSKVKSIQKYSGLSYFSRMTSAHLIFLIKHTFIGDLREEMLHRDPLSMKFPFANLPKELSDAWLQWYQPCLSDILELVFRDKVRPELIFSMLESDKICVKGDESYLVLFLTHDETGNWCVLINGSNEPEMTVIEKVRKIIESVNLVSKETGKFYMTCTEGEQNFKFSGQCGYLSGYYSFS